MALYRAQILLEDVQHEQLENLARESGRSLSDLVREIVAGYLSHAAEEESVLRSLAAIDGLTELRREIEVTHGPLPASFLEELREERDAELTP